MRAIDHGWAQSFSSSLRDSPLVALSVRTTNVPPPVSPRAFARPRPCRRPRPLPSPTSNGSIVFKDEKLQELIRTALERNYDLRDAVARVEEARANLGITRSNQFPNFVAGGNLEINRLSRDGATPLPPAFLPSQNRNFGSAALQLLSFEIDIWGRLRRATEAARANLLSAEENRQAVVTTLVSDVATAYLTLRELDYTLDISQRTLQTREQSLALTRSRQIGGVSTLLDLRQAEQLVYTAAETIPTIQQQIEQTENQITPPARAKSRQCAAGPQPHATGLLAGRSRRPAVGPAAAPSRYPGRGAGPDRRQCRNRGRPRRLLPASQSHRCARRYQHATHKSVQRRRSAPTTSRPRPSFPSSRPARSNPISISPKPNANAR